MSANSCQSYLRKQAKQEREGKNIDSRKRVNEYKQRNYGIITNGKRKAVFPSVLNLGWLTNN